MDSLAQRSSEEDDELGSEESRHGLAEEHELQSKPSNGSVPTETGDSKLMPQRKPRRPPHNYVSIVRDAEKFDKSSKDIIWKQLYDGVLLRQGKDVIQKYWVDREFNSNCFTIFASQLSVAWENDSRYWAWGKTKETSDGDDEVEVAVLKEVCWLDISGKFETMALSLGTEYEVSFVVQMNERKFGWHVPVNCKAILPDGSEILRKRKLHKLEVGKWAEVGVCKFKMSPDTVGELKFSLYDHNDNWKSGLVVKGVSIQPKKPKPKEANKNKASRSKNSRSDGAASSSSDDEDEESRQKKYMENA